MRPLECVPENVMATSFAAAPYNQPRLIRVLAWAAALCAVAIAFRFLVIEFPPVAAICLESNPSWWCAVRETIIVTFYSDTVGVISLFLGLVALLIGGRPGGTLLAIAAVISAAPSIVLYSADFAVPALLLGLLRLLRD